MKKRNYEVQFLVMDINNVEETKEIISCHSPYDILVNSAGIAKHSAAKNTVLDDYDIVMIDFWASWCPPCIQEASVLSSSYDYWQDKNIRFIGIALWDNETSVKKFVEKHDFKYDITLDKDGKYAINYGVKALPEKFFINRDGEIVKKYIGPIDKESLDKIIDEILEKE